MSGLNGGRVVLAVAVAVVAAGCASLGWLGPRWYVEHSRLMPGMEWRFNPVLVDLDGDGHLDLVATRRTGQQQSLYIWRGDGKGDFTPMEARWSSIGYGPVASGDLNGDGRPDLVVASHFSKVQTLINGGQGGFDERVLARKDPYVAAQLADVDGDGRLELILLGESTAIEIYRAETPGVWTLARTVGDALPASRVGRALAVADLNHDRHVDVVAAFQGAGVYVYYSDGRGTFTGGRVDFHSANQEFEDLAVADVNHDGHADVVINGAASAPGEPEGPDVYLGDGRGGWIRASAGLKQLKATLGGLAVGDLDRDGHPDIVAGGLATGEGEEGYGVFWFRGDGKGQWRLMKYSGLPREGLSRPMGIALGDIDRDGRPDVVVLAGMYPFRGSVTVWRQR
jgi:hypothetical protein